MKPEDVPDELTRTAMEGYYGHAVPDGGFAVLRGQWQRALAAVLPAHEAMVRAKVATEILAELPDPIGIDPDHAAGMEQAAQIARGEA